MGENVQVSKLKMKPLYLSVKDIRPTNLKSVQCNFTKRLPGMRNDYND